jgi:hypothetical protein
LQCENLNWFGGNKKTLGYSIVTLLENLDIEYLIITSLYHGFIKALLAILSDNYQKHAQFNAVVPSQKEMD